MMLLQEQENEELFDEDFSDRALRVMLATAQYQARRIARTLNLDLAAREDAEQNILMIMLERRRYFDPSRGAWTTFINRIGRQAAQIVADDIVAVRRLAFVDLHSDDTDETSINAPDLSSLRADDIYYAISLERYISRLPEPLRIVAYISLSADGDLAEAQRALGLSTSEFYRRVKELRIRLIALGFAPRRFLG